MQMSGGKCYGIHGAAQDFAFHGSVVRVGGLVEGHLKTRSHCPVAVETWQRWR